MGCMKRAMEPPTKRTTSLYCHYMNHTLYGGYCQVQVISEQQFMKQWANLTPPLEKRTPIDGMTQPREPRNWYGLGAVALILDLEEWQIKALSSEPYALIPEKTGSGRGSRNLYSFRQLLQIDLATALTRKSRLFTSELIPAGIRLVTDRLIKRWTDSYDAEGNAPPLILALNGQKWKILSREESNEGYREAQDDGTLWVSLNLVPGWESIVQEITRLEGEGEI